MLAECLTGFAIWAPGTIVIKAAAVLLFSRHGEKIITVRNLLALIPACGLCVGGYYLYESLILGNFISPLSGIPGYITQSVLSSALFVLLGIALDKFQVKKYINGGKTL